MDLNLDFIFADGKRMFKQRNGTSKGMVKDVVYRGGPLYIAWRMCRGEVKDKAEVTRWPHIPDLLGNLNERDSTLSIRNPTESQWDLYFGA